MLSNKKLCGYGIESIKVEMGELKKLGEKPKVATSWGVFGDQETNSEVEKFSKWINKVMRGAQYDFELTEEIINNLEDRSRDYANSGTEEKKRNE